MKWHKNRRKICGFFVFGYLFIHVFMIYYNSIDYKYRYRKVGIMKKTPEVKNPRLGQVGGQALLEGVMMRSGETIATSVRATDGTIKAKR